mmetsp:Transcript_6252/g.14792  ORF Transcript_6252/g.14792 Transcript_6252/m.14792 type:complete len:387 (-) Transcript_6252:1314-2474(-)
MSLIQCVQGCVNTLRRNVLRCQRAPQFTVEAGARVTKPTPRTVLPTDQLAYSCHEARAQGLLLEDLFERHCNPLRWCGRSHNREIHKHDKQPHGGGGNRIQGHGGRIAAKHRGVIKRVDCQWRQWRDGIPASAARVMAATAPQKATPGAAASTLPATTQELVHASVRPQAQAQCIKRQRQLTQADISRWLVRRCICAPHLLQEVTGCSQQLRVPADAQQHIARPRNAQWRRPMEDQTDCQRRVDGKFCGALVSTVARELLPALPLPEEVQAWWQEAARPQPSPQSGHSVVGPPRNQLCSLSTSAAAAAAVCRQVFLGCNEDVKHLDEVDEEEQRCGHPLDDCEAFGFQDAPHVQDKGSAEVTQEPRKFQRCCVRTLGARRPDCLHC